MLNEWTMMFRTEFSLDYWGKVWLMWAISLNIFFGLINILAVGWGYNDVKEILIAADIVAYVSFTGLAVWGLRAGRLGSGAYSVFLIFSFWIIWGCVVLL